MYIHIRKDYSRRLGAARQHVVHAWLVALRVFLGWLGLSLVVMGVWMAARSRLRRDMSLGLLGGTITLLGAMLVLGAFRLS
jgi:hypothetical protein